MLAPDVISVAGLNGRIVNNPIYMMLTLHTIAET